MRSLAVAMVLGGAIVASGPAGGVGVHGRLPAMRFPATNEAFGDAVPMPPPEASRRGAVAQTAAPPMYEPATRLLVADDKDLSPSAAGSVVAQPIPADYVRSLARPAGAVAIDPGRAEVATPRGSGWREIPNTKLVDVMAPSIGGGYLAAALQNWTGWGYIPTLRLAGGWQGGGHNGNNNSSVIGFDEKTLRPLEYYKPSPLKGLGAGGSAGDRMPGPEYPQNVHWYASTEGVLDPVDGRWKFMATSHVLQFAYLYDPLAGTVEKLPPYLLHRQLTTSDTDLGEDMTGLTAAFDPKRGIYLLHTKGRANQLSHFNLARRRWFGHGDVNSWGGYWGARGEPHQGQSSENAGYVIMKIDPKRDRLVAMSKEQGVGMLPLGWLKGRPDQRPGYPLCDIEWGHAGFDTAKTLSGRATFGYDPDHDDFLIYDQDPANARRGIVYRMDPETFAITTLAIGGPAPNEYGTYGRFWYSPSRKEWFTVANIDENFWVFRR